MNPDDIQGNWKELCQKLAPEGPSSTSEYEAPANKELASILRKMADHIETTNWPRVFGYSHVKEGPFEELVVTLSHPWGG